MSCGPQCTSYLTFSTEEERTALLGRCQTPFTHQSMVSFQKQPQVRGSEQVPPSTSPFDSRAGNCPFQNEHTAPASPGHPSLPHSQREQTPPHEGSNSVPENPRPPRSSAWDLLWKGLCRYHPLRGHPGSAWALNPMTGSYKTLRARHRGDEGT